LISSWSISIDGIYELEESRIRTAFMKAISAASARARVLSEEAGKQARSDMNRDKL
jgi:pyrroline-5-carboxylate reductase